MQWRPIKELRKEDIQDDPKDIVLGNSCHGPEMIGWFDLHSRYCRPKDIAQAIKDDRSLCVTKIADFVTQTDLWHIEQTKKAPQS